MGCEKAMRTALRANLAASRELRSRVGARLRLDLLSKQGRGEATSLPFLRNPYSVLCPAPPLPILALTFAPSHPSGELRSDLHFYTVSSPSLSPYLFRALQIFVQAGAGMSGASAARPDQTAAAPTFNRRRVPAPARRRGLHVREVGPHLPPRRGPLRPRRRRDRGQRPHARPYPRGRWDAP